MVDIASIVTLALTLFNFDGNVFSRQTKITNNSEFDYVIAGGGTAGCALAARLVQNTNYTVLLLEAGDNPNAIAMTPGLFFAEPGTSLDYTTNVLDNPLITTAVYCNKEDLTTFIKSIKDSIKFVSTPSFMALSAALIGVDFDECAHLEFATDEFWECYVLERSVPSLFYWGTCPVVDGDLKVIGIKNLREIDAAVIPRPMRGAVYSAILAIAEIAARKIMIESECICGAA